MRKTLLALAMVLMLAPMASAQQGPSPHAVDFEACYWAASIVGVNQDLGVPLEYFEAEDDYEPVDVKPVVLAVSQPMGAPFVVRADYKYKRELGLGLQYYQVAGSKTLSTDDTEGFTVHRDGKTVNVNEIEGSKNIRLSALDIYHLQNIAKTSESEYNLLGGWRFANWSLDGEAEYRDAVDTGDVQPDTWSYSESIASKISGPHIGFTGKRRFLVDPLFVTARLTISVLHDNVTANQKLVYSVGAAGIPKDTQIDIGCEGVQSPVDVDEAEIALKFESPRMAGMGGKIGYMASNWENMPVQYGGYVSEENMSIPARGKIGFCGWIAGVSFSF